MLSKHAVTKSVNLKLVLSPLVGAAVGAKLVRFNWSLIRSHKFNSSSAFKLGHSGTNTTVDDALAPWVPGSLATAWYWLYRMKWSPMTEEERQLTFPKINSAWPADHYIMLHHFAKNFFRYTKCITVRRYGRFQNFRVSPCNDSTVTIAQLISVNKYNEMQFGMSKNKYTMI